MENLELTLWIIGLVVGLSEIALRAVPSEKVKGLIGYAIDVLKVVSDFLNRRKPDDQIMKR